MKKINAILILSLAIGLISCADGPKPSEKSSIYDQATSQTRILLKEVEKSITNEDQKEVIPRTLTETGELHLVKPKDWTSGFFPGTLWLLYEETGDDFWFQQAKEYTALLEEQKNDTRTHDTGFKIYCSFGNGYRITGNEDYRDVIIETAKTLSTRFNPTVGAIRSWDHNTDKWEFPVIIDNMMNLELLFAATRFSGDSTFYNIAVQHANTTLKNHFREDFSTYHVIGYDAATGEVLQKNTHQGYSHESAWARGQAWALYGYTMSYRETGDEKYLEQAEKIADFLLEHPRMPQDLVPYWDFDAPNLENEPRDVSAAAIIASALFELSTYSSEKEELKGAAEKILASLSTNYASPKGANKGFILQNSTGHKPKDSEVDVPLNYADYYYLEALSRRDQLNENGELSL